MFMHYFQWKRTIPKNTCRSAVQHLDTHHNDILHNNTQHNDTKSLC